MMQLNKQIKPEKNKEISTEEVQERKYGSPCFFSFFIMKGRIPMTKIYGHRGAKGIYPENTCLSFMKAIEFGVDGIELDVHLTKDGEVVVIHDETLDRTTSGTGWIKDLTLAEIKKVSAGSRYAHLPDYDATWDKEKVPTLKEVLQLLAPYPVELNIELKTNMVAYHHIEEKVHNLVEQYGKGRKVVYSSFHLPTILRMREINSKANIAWLLNEGISLPEDFMKTFHLEALHLNKHVVLPKPQVFRRIFRAIDRLHVDLPKEVKYYVKNRIHDSNTNLLENLSDKIRVWTVNAPNEISQLLKLQVNTIMTDFPSRAIAIKKEQQTHV